MEILTLGQKIKKLRKEKGLTLKELAGERVTAAQISFIELGKSNPSHDLLEYLADKLSQRVDYFLETEEEQARKFADYHLKIANIELLRGDYHKAEDSVNISLHYSTSFRLTPYLGKAYLVKGDIAYNQKLLSQSSKFYLLANQQFLKEDNYEMIITTYIKLGKVHLLQQYFLPAIDYLKMAENYIEHISLDNPDLMVELYYNLMDAFKNVNMEKEVVEYIDICNGYLEKIKDKQLYGDSLLASSIAYRNMGDFEKAIHYANKSLETYQQLNSSQLAATVESSLGNIKLDLGDVEGCIYHLKKAIEIKKSLNIPNIVDNYLQLAKCYMDMELYELSEATIKEAQKTAIDFRDTGRRGMCYYYLYTLKYREKNYDEAFFFLDEYIDWMKGLGNEVEIGKAYVAKGNIYREMNENQLSLENFTKGYDILTQNKVL